MLCYGHHQLFLSGEPEPVPSAALLALVLVSNSIWYKGASERCRHQLCGLNKIPRCIIMYCRNSSERYSKHYCLQPMLLCVYDISLGISNTRLACTVTITTAAAKLADHLGKLSVAAVEQETPHMRRQKLSKAVWLAMASESQTRQVIPGMLRLKP